MLSISSGNWKAKCILFHHLLNIKGKEQATTKLSMELPFPNAGSHGSSVRTRAHTHVSTHRNTPDLNLEPLLGYGPRRLKQIILSLKEIILQEKNENSEIGPNI